MTGSTKHRSLKVVFIICFILSILSIGFSSWVYTIKPYGFDINVSTGNVINTSNFLKINNLNLFKYCKAGFVEDETISYKSHISSNLEVDVSRLKKELVFDSLNQCTISLSLYQNSNSNAFNVIDNIVNFNVSSSIESLGIEFTHSVVNNRYQIEINLTNLNFPLEIINLTCFFEIDVSNSVLNSSFEEVVYSKMVDKNIVFILEGGLKNVEWKNG